MRQKGILPPEYPVISEAEVNNMTDSYLKNLIQRNLVVSEAWLYVESIPNSIYS